MHYTFRLRFQQAIVIIAIVDLSYCRGDCGVAARSDTHHIIITDALTQHSVGRGGISGETVVVGDEVDDVTDTEAWSCATRDTCPNRNAAEVSTFRRSQRQHRRAIRDALRQVEIDILEISDVGSTLVGAVDVEGIAERSGIVKV